MFFLLITLQTLTAGSVYGFRVEGLEGGVIDFSEFRGKKILVVNTASECGFTKQYQELQKLYETYRERLVVVGFPSNDFGKQEPGTNAEIAEFCKTNYGITFPMAAKIKTRGDEIHPLYRWLTTKDLNHYADSEVKWNFQKYLIDENGNLSGVYYSRTGPFSEELIAAIER